MGFVEYGGQLNILCCQVINVSLDVLCTQKQLCTLLAFWITFISISYGMKGSFYSKIELLPLFFKIPNSYICMPLVFTHIDERVLFPFFLSNNVVVKYKSSIRLISRWSQLDLLSYHSWIYFTKILQRSERLSDISHSVLSVEGMMSGTANKVCVKSLNKAWNWRDACLSEAPQSHRLSCCRQVQLLTSRLHASHLDSH